MVKEQCHKNYSWSWSREKAKEFREQCNKAANCINMSKKGLIYTREECRDIAVSFDAFLVRDVTTYKDLDILSAPKGKYFKECLNKWIKVLKTKHDANLKPKLTEQLKKKLENIAKKVRKFYLSDLERLDLTRISNIKLEQIARNTKNTFETLKEEKRKAVIRKRIEAAKEAALSAVVGAASAKSPTKTTKLVIYKK